MDVPEKIDAYPDPWMFIPRDSAMPDKGMYLRHIDGITLDGIHFSYNSADTRPLILKTDVRSLVSRDITIDGKAF